jgi:hypothetical protein
MTDRISINNLTSEQLDKLQLRAEKAERAVGHLVDRYLGAEASLHRVRKLAEVWQDAPDPLARAMAADLRTTLNGPATAHDGPSTAECAADDAKHWNDKYAGEAP